MVIKIFKYGVGITLIVLSILYFCLKNSVYLNVEMIVLFIFIIIIIAEEIINKHNSKKNK